VEINKVVLVDEHDNAIGTMEKMEAHQKAILHRAFSIFIFNSNGEMLLQQRALNKYHSGGLWTNTCCSHPYPNETVEAAASRRLQEEMGFVAPLQKAFHFIYKANFDNGLTEFEYDHVFIGNFNGAINPSEQEVENYCYKSLNEIEEDLKNTPETYTIWFKIAFAKLQQWMNENKK
jgi:isopentenyl-diphosphate delta-isomerase